MNIKENSNHQLYLQALKKMSAGEKLQKVFELSSVAKKHELHELRGKFPGKTEREIMDVYLQILNEESEQERLINSKSFRL